MAVPGRVDAADLLLSLDPPPWHLRHSRAVAEVAGALAARIAARGTPIDRRLVEAAALLHDVDKLVAHGDPVRGLAHGAGSAAWLAAHGHQELGPAVACHPVTRLLDPDAADAWLAGATPEERVVAYADKRAGQRLESIDARFRSWRGRYPRGGRPVDEGDGRPPDPRGGEPADKDGWSAGDIAAVRERAGQLERIVCEAADVDPDRVGRLAWTGPALRAARARRAGR